MATKAGRFSYLMNIELESKIKLMMSVKFKMGPKFQYGAP